MKKLSYLLSAGVLVAMFAVVGCKKDDGGGITPEDAAGANFAGTWAVGTSGSVTFDSDDRTDAYSGTNNFVLSITYSAGQGSGTYAASGGQSGASPWPTSGTWEFQDDAPSSSESFTIVRTGNETLPIQVAISGNTMVLDFNFDDSQHQGSRVEAVNGDWTFNLVKQ